MVRAMLSESLRAVISQTLLKTKDGAGRVAAHEIMIGTPAIRNLIRENKIAQMYSAIQTGQPDRHADARPEPAGAGAAQRHFVGRSARQGGQQGQLRGLARRETPGARWNENRQSSSCYDLLRALVAKKGSDLFITAGFPPAIKIDGKMTPVSQPGADAAAHRDAGRAR